MGATGQGAVRSATWRQNLRKCVIFSWAMQHDGPRGHGFSVLRALLTAECWFSAEIKRLKRLSRKGATASFRISVLPLVVRCHLCRGLLTLQRAGMCLFTGTSWRFSNLGLTAGWEPLARLTTGGRSSYD